jgi:mannose-1-phosphate guanylyltransferase/mannose-1-phosphate guanylyltransferase/mannose-6-phosphate isomerase
MVIANHEHRFLIAEQLRGIGTLQSRIILEPKGRNTAPAAAVAALVALQKDPDSILLLMPADHAIPDVAAFQAAVTAGLKAAEAGHFVLFGITPTQAATGYGYIRQGEPLEGAPGAYRVAGFAEKPDRSTAEGYLASGEYAWNSGIFLLPARKLLEELERLEPELLQACREAVERAGTDAWT